MIPETLLALAVLAAPAEASSARVLLKASAAAAPACRTSRVDDQLVRAALFSPDSEQCPVARIGDEPIALRDLAEALELQHLSRSPRAAAPAKTPDMDFAPALDRLIDTRLLIQEAREVQVDATPEFRETIADFKESRQRTMLQQLASRSAKPDPAEVERLYRDAVREWEIASVLLEKEDDAKAFAAALQAGGSFDALAKKFVAEKRAKGGGKPEFASRKHMLPEVVAVVEKAKLGAPIGPIKVPSGFAVMRVVGTRHPPKDAAARADARARSLARMQHDAVRGFYLSLVRKYASVDAPLLKQLDFEAKGEKGFEELLKDQRPLATIRGDKPVTIGDLGREVSMKFFHGLAGPIGEKRVNLQKTEAFERLLGARLFAKEAAARKLEATPGFRRELEEYERALAFNTFVEKVIAPDVQVTEDEARIYYETHKAEFSAPEMFKLDGFAFTTASEAQAALDKLKSGTDFAWLRSTAQGQLAPELRSLQFDGRTVSAATLGRDLAKALTGARAGEYRLYAPHGAEVYVLRVLEQTPPTPQPYPEAREPIAKKLFNEKLAQAIRAYTEKLRKAQRVEVLITRVTL